MTDFSFGESRALPDIWVQNELLEQTRHYLVRGRRFGHLQIGDLNKRWAIAFRQFVGQRSGPHVRDMDDAGAELRLRSAGFPFHLVMPEVERLRRIIEGLEGASPSIDFQQRVREFVSETNRPKH